ncbi:MAG: hypothetical protein IGS48_18185 [Oscillatoriales cyanobacterium C42_A2020_001]|nr:hypothetical protein [Leptolyngbyaceae cyanobacterium C42_A2020_001]
MVAHIDTFKSDKLSLNHSEKSAVEHYSLSAYPHRGTNFGENSFHWRSIESLRLLVQIGLTFIVLSLCIGKLTVEDQDKALYWGGITSIVAWWMPSPGASKSGSELDNRPRPNP